MMQLIKKWEITVEFNIDEPNEMKFYIHDNHYQNVLRKLSDMSFDKEVTKFWIFEVNQQSQRPE